MERILAEWPEAADSHQVQKYKEKQWRSQDGGDLT